MTAVVGVTPTGRMPPPRSEFTNVVLPWLNSPTTTRWNRSAASFCTRSASIRAASDFAPMASALPKRSRSAAITSSLRLWNVSSMVGDPISGRAGSVKAARGGRLTPDFDDLVDLLVDGFHRVAAVAEVRVLAVDLALREGAQGEDA